MWCHPSLKLIYWATQPCSWNTGWESSQVFKLLLALLPESPDRTVKLTRPLEWNNNLQQLPLFLLQSTSQAFIKWSLITPLGHRCSKYLHEKWVRHRKLHKYSSDWLYELIHFICPLVLSFPTEFQAIKFYCHKEFGGNELQTCTQENLLMKGTWADPSKE